MHLDEGNRTRNVTEVLARRLPRLTRLTSLRLTKHLKFAMTVRRYTNRVLLGPLPGREHAVHGNALDECKARLPLVSNFSRGLLQEHAEGVPLPNNWCRGRRRRGSKERSIFAPSRLLIWFW